MTSPSENRDGETRDNHGDIQPDSGTIALKFVGNREEIALIANFRPRNDDRQNRMIVHRDRADLPRKDRRSPTMLFRCP